MIPIEVTANSMERLGSIFNYIRHIFNALRDHRELLEQPDYKRLHDEAEDFLFRYDVLHHGCDKNDRERKYSIYEFIANLENNHSHYEEKYSIDTVDLFLAERRKVWNS